MADSTLKSPAKKHNDPNKQAKRAAFDPTVASDKPQEYYDEIKARFELERDIRLKYRPKGLGEYTSDLEGELAKYEVDPYAEEQVAREPIEDCVECLFIGGGFSALLTAARLRERGVESIRIVERGSDVGGTWYWNRYPGAACDVSAYDYLPLLDEMGHVPESFFAKGPEIFAHCQNIARRYDLYDLAIFQTTVESTHWDKEAKLWRLKTDRGDTLSARFVICANGTLAKPKLSRIQGMETFKGHSFHTSRFDYEYCGANLENLKDKRVGIIGTGASAVQIIPRVGRASKSLHVFQRTPSAIDIRDDIPTDPKWAASLKPGWQKERIDKHVLTTKPDPAKRAEIEQLPRDVRTQRYENQNIEHQMRIHARVDSVINDPATAEALKPWYMHRCKRPCYDDEYLPAFNLPNVHLVDTQGKGVTQINERGVVFEGVEYPVDVLIYATGFEVQVTGIYNDIRGEDGMELNEKYSTGMRTVFGIHSAGYPNLFIMGGYQASFQFNLTFMLQTQGFHIAECIKYTRENGYITIDAKPDTEQWWVDEVIRYRGTTNRNKECTPGYYNFEGEENRRQDGNYNGGMYQYVQHLDESKGKYREYFDFQQ
ncbi:MAG: flavin-containing monooxygenase [Alphaproteobacteria bacterium]|jgi:cation diffusion facilitator CzcD-associated flavoprotein CzcO